MFGEVLITFCVCIVIAFLDFVSNTLVYALLAPQGSWHARSLSCRQTALSLIWM